MDAARLFFACAICLLLGAALGVFATRILYGDMEPVRPALPRSAACPACPDCPPCVSSEEAVPGSFEDEMPPPQEAAAPSEAGLPLKAIQAADAAVQGAVQPCLADGTSRGVRGAVVLDLRVRLEGGVGGVEEAVVIRSDLDDGAAEECVLQAASAATFQLEAPDGAGTLKVALRFAP